MAELLLELLSEEIPARMQAQAAEDLKRLVMGGLAEQGLGQGPGGQGPGGQGFTGEAVAFATPRRLTLVVTGLPLATPDVTEERRGPRVGAPPAALEGFLKSAGVSAVQCEERDTGKGVFYFAVLSRRGRPAAALIKEVVERTLADFPWPKSMRWGDHAVRWVRPLHGILCLFDGAVVPVAFGPVTAGDRTVGHRFLAPQSRSVRNFADYCDQLLDAKVILDPAKRRAEIQRQATQRAAAEGLRVKPDDGLLDEVTGLVEWPVALVGRIDEGFMDVPAEVLTTSMRSHQKYFSLLTPEGKLAPRFLVVANTETADGGKAVVAGNERVLRARLSDAKFFWDQDRKVRLEDRVALLADRMFYARLGTVADKVARMRQLARALAPIVKADPDLADRAALLAKADLSAGLVGEFPELQGIMGRYYALHDGESGQVAQAIADHYAPQGPQDRCPTAPVSIAVALADKLDSLAGFFAIGEKPTGSKDPFALRRAALGVIRLIVENGLRLRLTPFFGEAGPELLDFFADRLRVHLREKGVRHDLITAVFGVAGEDDLVRLLARVDALGTFLESEDGANLLVAYRRASNIVRIEEKKDGVSYAAQPEPGLLSQAEEITLFERLAGAQAEASAALAVEDFTASMAALASLRRPVDAFFDKVTVNCEDQGQRANRLKLLSRIRTTLEGVADFARIEGPGLKGEP